MTLSWRAFETGCVVSQPGNAAEYKTGDWKAERPVVNQDRCIKCGICYMYCPEGCIQENSQGYFPANLYYCKGCGICATECPTKAITMVEEVEA